MEATQADFDGTMRALFTFLLAPAGAGASATTAKAEEGAASGQVAALVRAGERAVRTSDLLHAQPPLALAKTACTGLDHGRARFVARGLPREGRHEGGATYF